jgi:hypothetical protein
MYHFCRLLFVTGTDKETDSIAAAAVTGTNSLYARCFRQIEQTCRPFSLHDVASVVVFCHSLITYMLVCPLMH